MDGEKPPVTKTMNFLMLPDDLMFNCLARVSRLYYPTLSLVCKRIRFLVGSMELYNTRRLLGCTESCLYVCLTFHRGFTPMHWFTLSRRPIQSTDPNPKPNPRWFRFTSCFKPYRILKNCIKKKENKSSENLLVLIPSLGSLYVSSGNLIADGSNIYKVDGYNSSSRVLFMDCRTHTWHEAPSMGVPRKWPIVNVLDGKIYVAERKVEDFDPLNWMDCFDPKTQIWENVPSPNAEILESFIFRTLVIEGKLYMYFDRSRCVVYKPKEKKWDEVGLMDVPSGWSRDSSCVIDNVLYTYRWFQKLEWYDFETRCWKFIKGLVLPRLGKWYDCVRLVDYGGKIAIFWERVVFLKKKIWCAEIVLERRSQHEIYGRVEWCGVVLKVPRSFSILKVLSVTV